MDPPAGTSWAALLAQIPEGARVLDIGCSTGAFAVAMARRGCRVTGVELNPEAADVARSRCDAVHVGDIASVLEDGSLPTGAFDAVVAADVLEHLLDPWAVLRACQRVLRRGGIVLASIPNVTHAAVILEMSQGRFPRRSDGLLDATHLQFFGRDSALALFADTGYEPELVDRVRRDPRLTEFASRLEGLSDSVLAFLDRNPDADTYQFIIRARPAAAARPASGRPRAEAPRAPLREGLVTEANDLRAELRKYHEEAVTREQHLSELNQRLEAYHAAMQRKDGEIETLHREIRTYHENVSNTAQELATLRSRAEALTRDVAGERALRRQRDAAARAVIGAVAAPSALRVLYVTEGWDAPFRYRCLHAAHQLRRDGIVANVVHIDDPDLLQSVASYSVIVLFRLPWGARVEALVNAAERQQATLIFEIDDLVFDVGAERLLPFFGDLPPAQRREYLDLFPRLRRTFDACHYFIGSTPALVGAAARLGKDAFLFPNLVSERYVRMAPFLRTLRRYVDRSPVIAYLSGSNTHDRDLNVVGEPLARLLHENPELRLLLSGFINPPQALLPFTERIVRMPYVDWRAYPWALARCRVVIAPSSVVNDFTNAKSALKFFEAGVFGVPTVATPTATFRDAIVDGDNGFLADGDSQWYEKIGAALDRDVARRIGARARQTVLERHSFAAHRGGLRALLHPLLGNAPSSSAPLLPLDPELRGSSFPRWRQARRRIHRAQAMVRALRWQSGDESATRTGRGTVRFGLQSAPIVAPLEPLRFERLLDVVRRRGAHWPRERRPAVAELAGGPENLRGWTLVGDLVATGDASYESSGRDPGLISPPFDVACANFRYLVVRMAISTQSSSPRGQIFWATTEAPDLIEERSVRWPVDGSGAWRTYVIDLRGTSWQAQRIVTHLRLDPIDCAGSIRLDRLALVADLAHLDGDADFRQALARRYLHGRGIECGALQNPLPMPPSARVVYVDRLTEAEARAHYPELQDQPLVSPSVVGDVGRLPFADGSLDFCVANHLLEHARDPIGGLEELLRVVRPGGTLFLSVPDAENPLDRGRPVTSFSHLLEDHAAPAGRREEDLQHYREAIASSHPGLGVDALRDLIERRVAQQYSIHFHTFDERSYRGFLRHVCARAGAVIEEFARHDLGDCEEHVAILRRTSRGDVDEVGDATRPPLRDVDIVVPIFNAREAVQDCVESVLRHARGDWRLVLVDDASTDTDLVAYLADVARRHERVQVLRQAVNGGFVCSANAGIRHACGRDVLLLNSDTVVAGEFLDRLRSCAYADESTGIVSPLSNNATICSVPEFCQPNPVPEGFDIDGFAALVASSSLGLRAALPTAVGFCMYIRAEVLRAVGGLDERSFPRGYGEENDLCERALAAGFDIRLADDVYVYHAGEASFGEATSGLKQVNLQSLERLHPGYFGKIAKFVRENPLAAVHENLKLALRRRHAESPALLVVLHASFDEPGGGTEHHVRDLLQTLRLPRAVVVFPEGDTLRATEIFDGDLTRGVRYRFPLSAPADRYMYKRADFEEALRAVVRLFGVGAVHIHHLLFWPITVWRVLDELELPFTITLHDYYAVCPSLNLVNLGDGELCCAAADGPRDTSACLRNLYDFLELPTPDDPAGLLARHRAEYRSLIDAARTVITPSAAARELVGRFFDLDPARTRVVPHGSTVRRQGVAPSRKGARPRIAILGDIAHPTKGAKVYRTLLEQTRHLDVEWHLFGNTSLFGYDDQLREIGLGTRLVLHGSYRREEVHEQLTRNAIDLGVQLPIWPETFSYTLSELLDAGVPVIASAQGALLERLRGAEFAVLVGSTAEAVVALERLITDRSRLQTMRKAAAGFCHRTLTEMADDYRTLYAPLFAERRGLQAPTLTLGERRQLFEAQRTARPLQPPPPAPVPLPHYTRWWYPWYERVAPLVPRSLRRWARTQVAERWWRAVRTFTFAGTDGAVVRSEGLELLHASGRQATYRIVHKDPAFVFTTPPVSTREARVIRFEMRCRAEGFLYAQLYWTHRAEEHFSEEKSIQIPVDGRAEGWQEYVVRIDETNERERWDAGEAIHHLRFDPLNTPTTIALRALQLCQATHVP